jgi:hypothetical protein
MKPSARSSTTLAAFLFTDIEGSSVRWLNHRAAMEKAVARNDAIGRREKFADVRSPLDFGFLALP